MESAGVTGVKSKVSPRGEGRSGRGGVVMGSRHGGVHMKSFLVGTTELFSTFCLSLCTLLCLLSLPSH